MSEETMFDALLDSVLCEIANPELAAGMEGRLEQRIAQAAGEVAGSPGTNERAMAGGVFGASGVASLWGSLWSGVRDALLPRSQPPLVLESRSVAVADSFAVDRSRASMLYAVGVHALAVLVIGLVVRAQVREIEVAPREVTALEDPVLHMTAKLFDRSGGGGGQRGPTPVSKGRLPQLAEQQIVPPSQAPLIQPRLAIEPTIEMQPMRLADNALPNVGMPNSPLAGVSLGNGRGSGIGSGDGAGVGPGTGGLSGGGLRHVGGGVSRPEVLYYIEPEFTEEARKAKVSGNVLVYLWVDEQGRPSHLRVARGMGFGLDQRALDAVAQYRFKPAMENGKPVKVEMYVDVNFNIL